MGAIRSQVGWMLRGRANTVRTLDALSNDLRELQEKVVGLERQLRELHVAQRAQQERQLDEFDRVRAAVTDAVDDLAKRIAAVDARR